MHSEASASMLMTSTISVVKSKNGLGIGLYQAATHAEQLGYDLRLDENGENGVRFELSSAAAPDVSLNYERYELSNGLDVVLHVDRSDPIAAVVMTFHVGSAREVAGKNLIQQAIDSAETGSVVVVPPGDYSLPIKITKPLTLKALPIGKNSGTLLSL